MPERTIIGEARIPLEEWVSMRLEAQKARILMNKTKRALAEVEVLLSFLIKERVVLDAMQKFNDQKGRVVFHVIDNRVKIELEDEAKEDSSSE